MSEREESVQRRVTIQLVELLGPTLEEDGHTKVGISLSMALVAKKLAETGLLRVDRIYRKASVESTLTGIYEEDLDDDIPWFDDHIGK